MKGSTSSMTVLACLLISVSATASIQTTGWYQIIKAEAGGLIEYVVLEGQPIAKKFLKFTITSLQALYVQNPDIFKQFAAHCLDGNAAQVPVDLVDALKKMHLIQDNATVSSVVQSIVSNAVEQLENGDIKIWILEELIKDGWVTLPEEK